MADELKKDIAELELLHAQATRQKVKDLLSLQINKLLTECTTLLAEKSSEEIPVPIAKAVFTQPRLYNHEVTRYAWDQSDKFMKIYVTLNGVQNLPKDAVSSEFTSNSFRMQANNLDNKNQFVSIAKLSDAIDPEKSYHKVKTDMVLVMLKKKEENKTWAYVTQREDKKKKKESKPDLGKDEDPQAGLMKMMQQMYEDGDDEMKRTIAKSWAESRDKQADMGGMGGLGGMGGM